LKIGKIFIGVCKKKHLHIGAKGKGLDYCNETGKSQRWISYIFSKNRKDVWED